MEDKNISNKKNKKFNIDFSNALIILIGVAMLSVIIYAFILRISSTDQDSSTPNQLNNQNTSPTKQVITTGSGYSVYTLNGQSYLEVTDGAKAGDVNGLLNSLNLPPNTEIINSAAGYARPVNVDAETEPSDHGDLDFGGPDYVEPEEPVYTPNE